MIDIQYALFSLEYIKQEDITGKLDETTISAIKAYQTKKGITADGKVTNGLANILRRDAGLEKGADVIDEAGSSGTEEKTVSKEEDNDSTKTKEIEAAFFTKDLLLRGNNTKITIHYGPNKSLKKTISGVFFRGVSQELDPSGNPINDIIEFIGKDLIEE